MIRNFLFKNQRASQTILKNTFWLVAGEAVSRTLRAITVIYAARILGAAGYGAFAFAMAISNFANIFSDLGVTSIVGREVAKNHEARARYFSNGSVLKLITLALNIAVILLILPPFVKIPEVLPLLPLISIMLVFDILRDFGLSFFRALERMEFDALVKIVMNILIVILGLYYLKTEGTAVGLTWSYIIGTGIGLILGIVLLFSTFRSWFAKIDIRFIKELAATSWPIGLLFLAGAFMINTDMIMLGWMSTPTDLGLYAAAQKPIQLLYVFPGLFASAMFPAMARFAASGSHKLRLLLESGTKATILISLPLAMGGILLAKPLVLLLYGAEYIGATFSLQLLLCTLVIIFSAAVFNNTILAFNKQRYFIRFFMIGAGANILFNAFLIPPFGIAGAAAATVFAQLFSNGLVLYEVKKISPFSLTKGLMRPVLATLVMGVVVWEVNTFDPPMLFTTAIGAIVYFAVLLLLREPLLKEVRTIIKPISPTALPPQS